MSLATEKYAPLVREAVAHYWITLKKQSAKKSAKGKRQGGRRSGVLGGKQMDGFCRVVREVLVDSGMTDAEIFLHEKLELPGYFRPTKKWDMLVVSRGRLVAAMEFKSQVGSFGKNFNNRAEEAIGISKNLWVAFRESAFGHDSIRPWIGWVMLLEDHPESKAPVRVDEPHFPVFPEFKESSVARRYELLLQKLVKERLFDGAAFVMATAKGGQKGEFTEPAIDLTMKAFLAGLAGHIGVHLASR